MGKKKKCQPKKILTDSWERYPHTHFNTDVDYKWLYQAYGLLRSWDKSLTTICQKLALIENHNTQKIVDELIYISDKVKDWIERLESAEANIRDEELFFLNHNFDSSVLLHDLTSLLDNFITQYTPLMNEVLNCIEERLKLHDQQISDIQSQIEDLQRQIDDLQSQINDLWDAIQALYEANSSTDWITMSEGTDYNIYFYNNFVSSKSPVITYKDNALKTSSATYHNITLKIDCKSKTSLTNSTQYSGSSITTPQFRHSTGAWNCEKSWIFSVGFESNLFTGYLDYDQKTDVWNMFPRSQRASWGVVVGAEPCKAGKNPTSSATGKGLLLNMRSIVDGYNQQYYTSYDNIYFGLCNLELEAYYSTTT